MVATRLRTLIFYSFKNKYIVDFLTEFFLEKIDFLKIRPPTKKIFKGKVDIQKISYPKSFG
jgi:hypothetical protein